jgi:hypothetical protein
MPGNLGLGVGVLLGGTQRAGEPRSLISHPTVSYNK